MKLKIKIHLEDVMYKIVKFESLFSCLISYQELPLILRAKFLINDNEQIVVK